MSEARTEEQICKKAENAEKEFYEEQCEIGERIDGIWYPAEMPDLMHQILTFEIGAALRECSLNAEASCLIMPLPVYVQLGEDSGTKLIPDISVVRDMTKLRERGISGAPDLIVEVLLPGSADRDRYLKLMKYMQSGVREYWVVDPAAQTVMVYEKDALIIPMTYTFEDCVPVGIWNRTCSVDFSRITAHVITQSERNKRFVLA